ncbi:multidrug efflux pump subunit AcrB [Bradyrhizobium sp. GM24.11]
MKRFNLSAWAVSHPTLVLFLMIILGVAGFFSYQKLGRAEDPFFTVKVVNVSVIWPGATAQEMQAQVADPIEKKIQELPYFEKVQTYSKPGFAALQVTFPRLHAAEGRALSLLSPAQEARRRAGPAALGHSGPRGR